MSRVLIGSIRSRIRWRARASAANRRFLTSTSFSSCKSAPTGTMPTRQLSWPQSRDGSVRVQVARIASQVSGQITEVRVVDNQYVHKGDVLYVIDPFDFQAALDTGKAQLRQKAADQQVRQMEAERRQHLSNLATTPEQQQIYAGSAIEAQAAFDAAQQQVAQADINLKRTQVLSPVNGYVTNLLMRVGDYAQAGT